jgi:hypothetical protein
VRIRKKCTPCSPADHKHVAIVGKTTERMPTEITARIDQWALKTLKKRKGKEHYKRKRKGRSMLPPGHKHAAIVGKNSG